MGRRRKKSKGILIKKAVKVATNARLRLLHLLQATGGGGVSVSIPEALCIAAFGTIFLAAKVAWSGKLVVAGDPWSWWIVAGAFGAGVLAMWVAILSFMGPVRGYRSFAKLLLLCLNMVAWPVLFAIGDLDPKILLV